MDELQGLVLGVCHCLGDPNIPMVPNRPVMKWLTTMMKVVSKEGKSVFYDEVIL